MSIKSAYDQAFSLLAEANCYEKKRDFVNATRLIGDAIVHLGNIYNLESDLRKKNLLASKIEELSRKRSELNHEPIQATGVACQFPDVPTYVPVTTVPTSSSSSPNLSRDDSAILEDAVVNGDRFLQEAQANERRSQLIAAKEFYIRSVECYLQAAKLLAKASRQSDRESRLRSICYEILNKIESIAAMETQESKPTSSQPASLSRNSLSAVELSVLRSSSTINNMVFLPWIDGDGGREKYHYLSPFTDPDGLLPLSLKHMSHFYQWRRLADIVKSGEPTMISGINGQITAESIVQDIVPDCSLVSSLCIACVFELRFRRRIVSCCIHPQDSSGKPVYNPSGKYMIRLFLNGIWRRVIIDDLFPVDGDRNMTCCSSKSGTEFWMTVIEKAYMKVNGGYDFPGSNSCIDLFALTGWIPEQIFLSRRTSDDDSSSSKDYEQTPERAWHRMVSAQGYGDCLITISTGPIATTEEAEYGLVSGHAYAVLDVKEVRHLRLLKIKNPWARRSWKGRFSAIDVETWTPALLQAVGCTMLTIRDEYEIGIFWMSYADVLTYFKTIFLNWNPELLRHKRTLHDKWPATQGPANDSYYIGQNPQYTITIPYLSSSSSSPFIWVLLTRHVTTKEVEEEQGDYLSLRIYSPSSHRAYYPGDDVVTQSQYTNNPNVLVRLDVSLNEYTIVLSQNRKSRDVCYSIMVFGTCEFELSPTKLPPQIQQRYSGTWMDGGPIGSKCFPNNPKVKFVVANEAKDQVISLHIELLAGKELSVRLDLQTRKQDETVMLGNSKEYRRGFCFMDYQAGGDVGSEFIVVPSTYTEQSQGSFIVTICCSHQFSLVA